MRLYTISDPHLSFGCDKPMDIFKGWHDHVARLEENWNRVVSDEDVVVVGGDISWGMSLAEAKADFAFLNGLNGKKIILRGNHDYWFSTYAKRPRFLNKTALTHCRFSLTMRSRRGKTTSSAAHAAG